MEDNIKCSICNISSASVACKCEKGLVFLGSCCEKVHFSDISIKHSKIALYLAKYLIRQASFISTSSEYMVGYKELLGKLEAYYSKIKDFKSDLVTKSSLIIQNIHQSVSKFQHQVETLENELICKLHLLRIHQTSPLPEAIKIIDKYREGSLKLVLTNFYEVMSVNDTGILKKIDKWVYMGNEQPAEKKSKPEYKRKYKHIIEELKEEIEDKIMLIQQKKSMISHLHLKVQQYKDRYDEASSKLIQSKETIQKLQNSIQTYKDSLQEQKRKYEGKIEDLNEELEEFEQNVSEKQIIISQLESKMSDHIEFIAFQNKEHNSLKATLKSKTELATDLQTQLEVKNSLIAGLSSKLEEVKEVLNSGYEYIEELESQNSYMNSVIEQLRSQIKSLKDDLCVKENMASWVHSKDKKVGDVVDEMINLRNTTQEILNQILATLASTKRTMCKTSEVEDYTGKTKYI